MKPDRQSSGRQEGFVVWITGLPASGKSTIAVELLEKLGARGMDCARLESDALRQVMHGLDYSPKGRDSFYETLAWIAKLLVDHGVGVVIDATANQRRYRDDARREIRHFVEVHVNTPLEVCMARDPKGLYQRARNESANDLPGSGVDYEPPIHPEVTVSGVDQSPAEAANSIVAVLAGNGCLAD